MESAITKELFVNINSFINEIDLSFDYIDITNITKYVKTLDNLKELEKFIYFTYIHLKPYEKELSYVLLTKQKYKSEKMDFLNNILLFGDKTDNCLLEFKLFNYESKNTKKGFVKYLYNIYLSCFFLHVHSNKQLSSTELTDELNTFVSKIQQDVKEKDLTFKRRNAAIGGMSVGGNIPIPSMPISPTMPDFASLGLGAGGSLEGIMSSLMGNKDILNIASQISEQMKNEKINPMSMLSGLMSGKMDSRLSGLVDKIQENVENKFTTGEINKQEFEEQAKNIIKNVTTKTSDNNIPGLSNIINAMNSMNSMNEN